MTNEEWIEELYHLSHEIGKYNEMHGKVNECRKKHPDLNTVECAELAYIEWVSITYNQENGLEDNGDRITMVFTR